MSVRTSTLIAGWLLSGLTALAQAVEPTPPSIGIRITILGPTFVDAHGMTLYRARNHLGYEAASCPDDPQIIRPVESVAVNVVAEFPMWVPDAASRKSCTQKYPPLLAPMDAKPIGHWSIHLRENGIRQWTYRGRPIHRSMKDKAPGELNGWSMLRDHHGDTGGTAWENAAAPLDAPDGIESRLTSLGLALTTRDGRPLYHPSTGTARNEQARDENWKPFIAPLAVTVDHLPPDWSLVSTRGGLRQWAWKGNPLYTYADDSGDNMPADLFGTRAFTDVFGEAYGKPVAGWQVALLKRALAPPPGIRVTSIGPVTALMPSSRIYTSAAAMTLYVLSCLEQTLDQLDCDDVGDSPSYWLNFCGGEERCMKTWRPLPASSQAKPTEDGLWSVALINPRHPYKVLQEGEQGVRVWTFQGRFVFTYAADEKPGDTRGRRISRMSMNTIPAFAP